MASSRRWRVAATAVIAAAMLANAAFAQTWSSCNPLYTTTCPANTALGMNVDVEFTNGAVNSFVASGGIPTYGADGATFTVAKSGDAPQLTSVFYIMFGRVEVTMKSAPGAGIVSSLVLQSDDLDEIDMEWLGADSTEVQTNYFGKGQTGSFNRGQFNPAANNQGQFIKYTIDWTADRIMWYVDGTAVRTLTFNDAAGQYPQTPMQIKFGAWSGGDPSNPSGTIEWARGPTDYSKGPFSMSVKSVVVSDYSTGKSYTYGDTSGTWQSIKSDGGTINGNLGKAGSVTVTASASAVTSLSPSIPAGGIGRGSNSATLTQTGWPWVATGTPSNGGSTIPSGWVMTPEGKIVPASSSIVKPPQLILLLIGSVVLGLFAVGWC
ncbi:glycoside hydrolase family 16 protein [Lasiosphaeria miniovina]|uniref:chitinase n=1 Tax=Lasiosphaeria miniovina TaxID=1954250 RepID=A0AA40BH26_9PEZI|nr:glycoside hydrolase family 16 protein [Lasiosphaeria miniovina]KAK0734109.1 glycoside hydrolase family 16 protein [Lasiosphaeria miniovina]